MTQYSKNDICERKSEIDKCERKERNNLLKEHTEKYNALKKKLQDDCIASGVRKMTICHGDTAGLTARVSGRTLVFTAGCLSIRINGRNDGKYK